MKMRNPWRLLSIAGCLLAAGGNSIARPGTAVPSPCPSMDSLREEWVEHEDPVPPPRTRETHLGMPLRHASALMVTSFSVSYWAGASERTDQTPRTLGSDPACYVVGSAAFYYNGTEDSPELDMVETLQAGGEESLGGRLVELRWFDPADGLRHRWFNVALARRLGWLTDPLGRTDPRHRPIPLPLELNALY